MYLEIILTMILIFLVIIAIQNSARGGMQADYLQTIIRFTNSIRSDLEYLTTLKHKSLDRNDNLNKTNIVKEK